MLSTFLSTFFRILTNLNIFYVYIRIYLLAHFSPGNILNKYVLNHYLLLISE